MRTKTSYTIFQLGDTAITVDFGNSIDPAINNKVLSLFYYLKQNKIKGMKEVVAAYSSLTIYYDVLLIKKMIGRETTAYEWMKNEMQLLLKNDIVINIPSPRHIKIPVCYDNEFATDLEWISSENHLPAEEIVALHTGRKYRVYMIGFLPGFAYMGEVDEKIAVPRRIQPRQYIEAGSVGIAGKQTGIYPLNSPGGWHIIGRTPIKLFSAENFYNEKAEALNPVFPRPGDEIEFYTITKEEFISWNNEHSHN